MANLMIVVDDQLLQAARIKALQFGTGVNEACRDAIARFAHALAQHHGLSSWDGLIVQAALDARGRRPSTKTSRRPAA